MICCSTVDRRFIQRHYDISTLFYRLLWGPHIHHGLWYADESIRQAQLQLTETLAAMAGVRPQARVLDVGCGMGASSIHLAQQHRCSVTGVTISPLQRCWASLASRFAGVGSDVRFVHADAEVFEAHPASLDLVWSIECTEHLFDKARFFRRVGGWLRPGGRVVICAWLAGDGAASPPGRQLVHDVCEGFLCPSLGTMSDYVSWFEAAGLRSVATHDWTPYVMRTWEICRQRVARSGVRLIAPWLDRNAPLFLERFDTILEAYRSGAMQYGCFVAEKPRDGALADDN